MYGLLDGRGEVAPAPTTRMDELSSELSHPSCLLNRGGRLARRGDETDRAGAAGLDALGRPGALVRSSRTGAQDAMGGIAPIGSRRPAEFRTHRGGWREVEWVSWVECGGEREVKRTR